MAPRSTTPKPISRAAQKAAERGEEDLSKYLDKEPTDLQVRYSDWIVDKVGIEFGTAKEMDAFILGAQLSAALRMKFQASPENQAVLMENRSKPKKSAAKKPAKPAPEEEPDGDGDDEPEEEAPAPKPTRAATRRGSVKPKPEPEPEPEEDLEAEEGDDLEDDEPEEEAPAPKPTRATARKRTGATATATSAKPAPATTARRRGTTTKRASSAAPF